MTGSETNGQTEILNLTCTDRIQNTTCFPNRNRNVVLYNRDVKLEARGLYAALFDVLVDCCSVLKLKFTAPNFRITVNVNFLVFVYRCKL